MKKGFTLIELLVVITIMGVLMGLLLVAFQGTRKTARDGKRKADLAQISVALEMYRSDKGKYPIDCVWGSNCGHGESDTNSGIFQTSGGPLISTYMPPMHDPIETGGGGPCYGGQCLYRYRGVANGSQYVLETYLETGAIFWQICSSGQSGQLTDSQRDGPGECGGGPEPNACCDLD